MSTKNKELFSPEKIVDNLLDFEEKLRAGTAKGMSYEEFESRFKQKHSWLTV